MTTPALRSARTRFGRGALIGLVLAVVALVVPAGTTAASPPTPFYETPASLPARNGDLVRSEPATFYIDPLKAIRSNAVVHRVMYRSTDRLDRPIAVTGTVLTPRTAWTGAGQRPLVAYAVGTQGLGDQCAPSQALAAGSEYEGLFISGLLARGWAVVVTDYQGLGTDGLHTYMSREVQGRAVLDSVRAAQRLPEADIPDAGPVAITGYSQGGGAAASAAELAAGYAPEIDLRGVVAGAVPGDLTPVAANLDGSLYFGFLGYAVAGLAEGYDVDVTQYLNARGQDTFSRLAEQCTVGSLATFPFTRSRDLTKDGRPVTDLMAQEPFRSIVAEQRLGDGRRPSVPTLMTHSALDDVIPYSTGKALARRWCGQGADVRFSTNFAPLHVGGALRSYPESFLFLENRFANRGFSSNCWLL